MLTGSLGSSSYFGDLVSNMPYNNLGASFSAGFRKSIYPRISLGIEAGVVTLSGKDVYAERGLSFNSVNYELVGIMEVSLFKDPRILYRRRLINPYVNFGIGALYFQPKAKNSGTTYKLADYETNGEKYSPVTVIVPSGLGMKVKVTDELDLALEFGFRMTFTDFLDDISGPGYPSWNFFSKRFGSDTEKTTVARLLSYGSRYKLIETLVNSGVLSPDQPIDPTIVPPRGNMNRQDFYMTTMIRAFYYLPVKHARNRRKRGYIKKRKRFR
ncbi:MAG: DUF6089 family protein [Cytophagales bacterium]|nr:DUF6089 family protein [Cytophagales bacterium]